MLERLAAPGGRARLRRASSTARARTSCSSISRARGSRPWSAATGPLPPEQLVPLALQLCSALHYLAAEGVVHLDLKPANTIMSGPPRLIDLSVAIERSATRRRSTRPIGTDAYMAPEQCDPAGLGPGRARPPTSGAWERRSTAPRPASGRFRRATAGSAEPSERWPQLAADPDPRSAAGVRSPSRSSPACDPVPSAGRCRPSSRRRSSRSCGRSRSRGSPGSSRAGAEPGLRQRTPQSSSGRLDPLGIVAAAARPARAAACPSRSVTVVVPDPLEPLPGAAVVVVDRLEIALVDRAQDLVAAASGPRGLTRAGARAARSRSPTTRSPKSPTRSSRSRRCRTSPPEPEPELSRPEPGPLESSGPRPPVRGRSPLDSSRSPPRSSSAASRRCPRASPSPDAGRTARARSVARIPMPALRPPSAAERRLDCCCVVVRRRSLSSASRERSIATPGPGGDRTDRGDDRRLARHRGRHRPPPLRRQPLAAAPAPPAPSSASAATSGSGITTPTPWRTAIRAR